MNKDVYILGISESHNATAALVKNGKLIAAASEERFSRKKTHSGFPTRAINYVLKKAGIGAGELDLIVSSFQNHAMYSLYEIDEELKEDSHKAGAVLQKIILKVTPLFRKITYYVKPLRKIRGLLFRIYYPITQKIMYEPRVKYIENKLGISADKIRFAAHHTAHIYASYAMRTMKDHDPVLIMTLDGEGDEYCATVGVYKNGKYERISSTPNYNSVGKLYQAATVFLGMKPNEHEYKVMGLAPYSETKRSEAVYTIIKDLIWVDDDLVFHSQMDDTIFDFFIKEKLQNIRFDYIGGGFQLFTERLVLDWVKRAIKKTGINNIIFGGGVFMNVKLNKLIMELPELNDVSFCPSCGDESTAIGAAFYGYELAAKSSTDLSMKIDPVGTLYLGPAFGEADFDKALEKPDRKGLFEKVRVENIERKVAELVSNGEIVAIMFGRMEFGARALGNRSILADPRKKDIVDQLNRTIKMRDFWMPFASSIMKEREEELINNPKNILAPYMMLAFDTTKRGKEEIKAALHPADFTTRPQIVEKSWNQRYWNIINEFQKLTGVGGVLNTSFNIHGEPVVCSSEDALHTMECSEIKWLATENFLIRKI